MWSIYGIFRFSKKHLVSAAWLEAGKTSSIVCSKLDRKLIVGLAEERDLDSEGVVMYDTWDPSDQQGESGPPT